MNYTSNTVISCSEIFIPENIIKHNKMKCCICKYPYIFNLNFEEGTVPISVFSNFFYRNGFRTYEIASKIKNKFINYTFKNIFFKVCKYESIFRRNEQGFVKYFNNINELIKFFKNNNVYNPHISFKTDTHNRDINTFYFLNKEQYTIYCYNFSNSTDIYIPCSDSNFTGAYFNSNYFI